MDEVEETVVDELEPCVDEIELDRLGVVDEELENVDLVDEVEELAAVLELEP